MNSEVRCGIQSTIVSEGFKGGTRGAPIMPRDTVSRTANVERNGGHKWVKTHTEVFFLEILLNQTEIRLYLPFSD